MADGGYGSCSPNLSVPGHEQIFLSRADLPRYPTGTPGWTEGNPQCVGSSFDDVCTLKKKNKLKMLRVDLFLLPF